MHEVTDARAASGSRRSSRVACSFIDRMCAGAGQCGTEQLRDTLKYFSVYVHVLHSLQLTRYATQYTLALAYRT